MRTATFIGILTILAALTVKGASLCALITTPEPDAIPLRNATLTVVDLSNPANRFQMHADPNGKACFVDRLPEGLYSVEAEAAGFLSSRFYPVRVVFPRDILLTYRLPIGEVSEGGLSPDVILSGTLKEAGKPSDGVTICITDQSKSAAQSCVQTNDLGQYAITVPPGEYRVDFYRLKRLIHSALIKFPVPGVYRDRLTVVPH